MNDSEALQIILKKLEALDNKTDVINSKLSTVNNKVDALQEDSKVTRGCVNTLLEWAEKAQKSCPLNLGGRSGMFSVSTMISYHFGLQKLQLPQR